MIDLAEYSFEDLVENVQLESAENVQLESAENVQLESAENVQLESAENVQLESAGNVGEELEKNGNEYESGHVAVKSIKWAKLKEEEKLLQFENEIISLQSIRIQNEKNDLDAIKCPFLVDYVGFVLYDLGHPCVGSIVIKWYSFGNLSSYSSDISNPKKFVEIKESIKNEIYDGSVQKEICQLLNFALQIAQAMDHLNNTLKIIHRDLKGDNVFLTKKNDGELIVKVGDFGISLNQKNKLLTKVFRCGTIGFMVRD